jgi:hypothetical protein
VGSPPQAVKVSSQVGSVSAAESSVVESSVVESSVVESSVALESSVVAVESSGAVVSLSPHPIRERAKRPHRGSRAMKISSS